jgi:hypothetical protein
MDISKINEMVCNMIASGQKTAQIDGISVSITAAVPPGVKTSLY